MKRYNSTSGTSGILAYELGAESIKIVFRDGEVYLYDYEVPGKEHVEQMKKLAPKGKGLATYINQHVRERYKAKLS